MNGTNLGRPGVIRAVALGAIGLAVVLGVVALMMPKDTTAPKSTAGPNFLIFDIDSFSWDHMGVVRDGKSNTPNMDAIAARGTKFTQAISHSGWTLPSMGALLTGDLPVPGSARDNAVPWYPPGTQDLPEIMGIYGYNSAAFFGDRVDGGGAFAKHFGKVFLLEGLDKGTDPPTEQVLAYLELPRKRPFLAYVHDVNLHKPYAISKVTEGDPVPPPTAGSASQMYSQIYYELAETMGKDAAQEAIKAHYDAQVGLYDERVGQVMAKLEMLGQIDNTVIIITSDHGDDIFEHADVAHGLLYDSTIKVPFVIADPTASEKGKVVDVAVQTSDMVPTILERAGVQRAANMTGRSLLPLMGVDSASKTYEERPAFSLTDRCNASWRTSSTKLVVRQSGGTREWYPLGGDNQVYVSLAAFAAEHGLTGLPMPSCAYPGADGGTGPESIFLELFDLKADPGERKNLISERADEAAPMLTLLLNTLEERRLSVLGTVGDPISAKQVQGMRQQGYWGFVTDPNAKPEAKTSTTSTP